MTDSPTSRKVRPSRVYRVEITRYPEGSLEPGWRPECWRIPDPNPLLVPSGLRKLRGIRLRRALARETFRWPRSRLFLSSEGAWFRAWRLNCYGAKTRVAQSNPVTWPENGNQP